MKKMYYYDTLCHSCGKLNSWQLTPNRAQGEIAEKIVNDHKTYSEKYPFDIRDCEHCSKDTRQESVAWYDIPYSE